MALIIDERRAKSTVLQWTARLVDLETDREVLMLYSSFLCPVGRAVLWSYAPWAGSIGVVRTGGGVEIPGMIDMDPLTWDEFSRDLRLCVSQENPIHIFSLEGCVNQGFLSRLSGFDWNQSVKAPGNLLRVRVVRTKITAFLWLFERPWVILVRVVSLLGLAYLFMRSERD